MKVQEHFIVRLGGNDYLDTPNLVAYKGEPILKVTRDQNSDELAVEAEIFDSNGRCKAVVHGTELVRGDPESVEIRSTANNYSIRDRETDRVVCEIRRRASKQKMDLDISLLMHTPDGFLIHANPAQCNVRLEQQDDAVEGSEAAISLT